jgi:protein-tyrosine phosphatase
MATWDDTLPGVVTLPDGRRVRGRSLRDRAVSGLEVPDFGLYLTTRRHEESRWESRWICWRDFVLPRVPAEAVEVLSVAYDRAASSRVEVACGRGNGRTGTALAILARYGGVPPDEAVAWVRENFRRHAVELLWQRRFAETVDLRR